MVEMSQNRGERILVLAEADLNLTELRVLLERHRFGVVAARDPVEAARLAEAEAADLLLVDGRRSDGLEGIRLLSRIRQSTVLRDTPTIFLLDPTHKDDDLEFLELGAVDFLFRPYSEGELVARIHMNLTTGALRRELDRTNREIARAYEHMRRDLEAASRMQHALLPSVSPEDQSVRFAWLYEPCDQLGGDSLRINRISSRIMQICIVDVSGHGVPAALLSVSVAHRLQPALGVASLVVDSEGEPTAPSVVAQQLNTLYPMADHDNHYLTMLYGLLDLETFRFRYVCGGHPGPIHVRREGRAEYVKVPGRPIGIFGGSTYADSELQLEPGDRLFVFSDGLYEEHDREDVEFGIERLVASLDGQRERSLEDALQATKQRLFDWHGSRDLSDDFSILGVEIVSA